MDGKKTVAITVTQTFVEEKHPVMRKIWTLLTPRQMKNYALQLERTETVGGSGF